MRDKLEKYRELNFWYDFLSIFMRNLFKYDANKIYYEAKKNLKG